MNAWNSVKTPRIRTTVLKLGAHKPCLCLRSLWLDMCISTMQPHWLWKAYVTQPCCFGNINSFLMCCRKFLESLGLSMMNPFHLWTGIEVTECLRPWCIDGEFHMRYSQTLKNPRMMSCSNTLLSHFISLCLLLALFPTQNKIKELPEQQLYS